MTRNIDKVRIRVELCKDGDDESSVKVVQQEAVEIELGGSIRLEDLIDASQRSVAHCIDELKKYLQVERRQSRR